MASKGEDPSIDKLIEEAEKRGFTIVLGKDLRLSVGKEKDLSIEIGKKKGRFPFRRLSRQPSYRSARCLLLGTWEGFDWCSIPALPRDANRVSVSARFAAIALALARAGCSAPSAYIQAPYDISSKSVT